MRILIIGCGYVGMPLARQLAAQKHEVFGLRRSALPDEAGIRFLQADITCPDDLQRIAADFDIVINTVSSTRGGREEYREVYLEGTRRLLAWLKKHPPRLYLYTSSTSVYAQSDGSWVTEESESSPDSPTSRVLVDTERLLLDAHTEVNFPAVILRVAGIYGPERGHLFKQFLRGEAAIRDDGSAYINSVHVDDVAGAIGWLIESGKAGQIYNVADNEPVTQLEFFTWLAQKLARPLPPNAPADPNRKRGLTNKRVSNRKLRETGFRLSYPTFREGYSAEMVRLGLETH